MVSLLNDGFHQPVLLQEVLQALKMEADGIYIDATYGRGGHSDAILAALGAGGRLLAIDRDPEAVAAARRRHGRDSRFEVAHAPFSELLSLVRERGWLGRVCGVLLDLGVSSPQLDDGRRGFGFRLDGPLDMRMDSSTGVPLADWLASASEQEISTVLRDYGEERNHRRLARAIVAARAQRPLRTTGQLADLVKTVIRPRPARAKKDPATRTFLAFRIFVNKELEQVRQVLPQVVEVLKPAGRLAVISFHSLEDRIVKQFLRDQSRGRVLPAKLPVPGVVDGGPLKVIGRAQRASDAEIQRNPRARSAVLRVAEKRESTE